MCVRVGVLLFLHHLLKSNPFFIELPWVLCWKSVDHMCVERWSLIRHFSTVMGESCRNAERFLDLVRGWEGVPSCWLLSEAWFRVMSGEWWVRSERRKVEESGDGRNSGSERRKAGRPEGRSAIVELGWGPALRLAVVTGLPVLFHFCCLAVWLQAHGKWQLGSSRLRGFHRQEWKRNRKVSKGICLE